MNGSNNNKGSVNWIFENWDVINYLKKNREKINYIMVNF